MKKLLILPFLLFFVISNSYADFVRIIDNPDEAYSARMHLIESAKEEISISYFIFSQDASALEFLTLLRKKAREGVNIRIMVDDLFNDIPKDIGTHLQDENVLIKNFNTFNLFRLGKSLKYRMHDKMFIVDRQKIIMGGRNIEDTYFGRADKNYDDRDLYIVGDIAEEASLYFDKLWQANHLKPFKQVKLKNSLASERLDEIEANLEHKKTIDTFNLISWEKNLTDVESVTLFHDSVNTRKKKMTGTAKGLYDLILNAKKSVIIDTPYLIMTKEFKKVLTQVLSRGVSIRILTNSLKSTDGLFPQAAYIGQRKKIVRMGIHLYEYYANESFHSKSLVIDDEIAAIGSFNFDPRSQNLNTETMAILHDTKIAELLTLSMNENIKESYRIDENGMPENQTSKLPGVSLKKKILTRLIQFLVVPFARGLL